jgi:hypothetical protein
LFRKGFSYSTLFEPKLDPPARERVYPPNLPSVKIQIGTPNMLHMAPVQKKGRRRCAYLLDKSYRRVERTHYGMGILTQKREKCIIQRTGRQGMMPFVINSEGSCRYFLEAFAG